MINIFSKKYFRFILLLLALGIFWSVLFSPSMTLFFVIAAILCSLAISTSSILEKHKGSENQRQKITHDILILLTMFILVILIGGWIGLWAGKQAEGRLGAVAAVLCALAVSFAVGYLFRKVVG